jgi:hypothetical protein
MLKRNLGLLGALAIACVSLAAPAYAVDTSLDGNLRGNCGTATGTSNASTLANKCGLITTESASTAAAGSFTETITDTVVAATDVCLASVQTGGTGSPVVMKVTPAAGSLVILISNVHATAAFNNTLGISFFCIKK